MKRCELPLWLVVSFLFLPSVFPAIGTGHPHRSPNLPRAPDCRPRVLPLSRALEDLKTVQLVLSGNAHQSPTPPSPARRHVSTARSRRLRWPWALEMFQKNHQATLDQLGCRHPARKGFSKELCPKLGHPMAFCTETFFGMPGKRKSP